MIEQDHAGCRQTLIIQSVGTQPDNTTRSANVRFFMGGQCSLQEITRRWALLFRLPRQEQKSRWRWNPDNERPLIVGRQAVVRIEQPGLTGMPPGAWRANGSRERCF